MIAIWCNALGSKTYRIFCYVGGVRAVERCGRRENAAGWLTRKGPWTLIIPPSVEAGNEEYGGL